MLLEISFSGEIHLKRIDHNAYSRNQLRKRSQENVVHKSMALQMLIVAQRYQTLYY